MKGLTLHEPRASLIASGVKTIETRSWRRSQQYIGERIFFHAAKRKPTQDGLETQTKTPRGVEELGQ